MIEMPTVTDSNRFNNNKEKTRKGSSHDTEFSELNMNAGIEFTGSQPASTEYKEEIDEMVSEPYTEVATYTFSGKKSLFGKFTGRNLDFEI